MTNMSEMNKEQLEKQFEEKSKILDLMIQCLPQMEAKDRKLAEATDEETRKALQAEISKFQEEYTELLAECACTKELPSVFGALFCGLGI